MKLLRKHKLYVGLSNYDFYEYIIHNLGHIISNKGISIDPKNIEAIMSWHSLRKMADVRSFVGLAGYWKFIEGYSACKVELMYMIKRYACELVVP